MSYTQKGIHKYKVGERVLISDWGNIPSGAGRFFPVRGKVVRESDETGYEALFMLSDEKMDAIVTNDTSIEKWMAKNYPREKDIKRRLFVVGSSHSLIPEADGPKIKRKCRRCDKEHNFTDLYGRKLICKTCLDETSVCEICGSTNRDCTELNFKNPFGEERVACICVSCVNEEYIRLCVECGLWHNRNHSIDYTQNEDGKRKAVCHTCWDACCSQDPPKYTQAGCGHKCLASMLVQLPRRSYCPKCGRHLIPMKATTYDINRFKRLVGIEFEGVRFGSDSRPQLDPLLGFCKFDGSLRGRGTCFEYALRPATGDALLDAIRKACDLMCEQRVHSNSSCGLHVHLDMNKESEEVQDRVLRGWLAHEGAFYSLVPQTRAQSSYCVPLSPRANNWLRDPRIQDNETMRHYIIRDAGRYQALNLQALSKFGTLEFRLLEGSIDANRVEAWTMLLLHMVEAFKEIPLSDDDLRGLVTLPKREQLSSLFKTTGLPDPWRKRLLKDAAWFHGSLPKKGVKLITEDEVEPHRPSHGIPEGLRTMFRQVMQSPTSWDSWASPGSNVGAVLEQTMRAEFRQQASNAQHTHEYSAAGHTQTVGRGLSGATSLGAYPATEIRVNENGDYEVTHRSDDSAF